MAGTPHAESGPIDDARRARADDLDREVERRAEHVAEEEADPLKPAREERQRQSEQH